MTATDMDKSAAIAYYTAEKGEEVIINHNRYPGVIFILSARDRGEPLRKGNDKIEKD